MLDATRWDADLIRRYDQAGPRYWSYPTALQFDSLSPFDLLHALRRSRHADRPLSLCHSARTRAITAAAKVVTEHRARTPYLQWLAKEIELTACHLGADQVVEQLHSGRHTELPWPWRTAQRAAGCANWPMRAP